MDGFFDKLGADARVRADPTLQGAVVAAGAVLAVVGLMAIALDGYDGDTSILGIAFGLVAMAAGYATLLKLEAVVRPAGIALVALGTFQTLVFIFDDLDTPSTLLLLLAVAYAGQWGWSPARGSTTLLTLSLFSMWAFLIDVAQSDTSSGGSFVDDTLELPATSFTNGDDTSAYLSLAIGVLLLFGARALDGRGWRGIATSAVIVGDIAFVFGVFGVVATFESDVFGSVLIIVAGLILATIGANGERRFTTWLGGIGVFAGLVALLTTAFDFSDAVQFGVVAVIVGSGLIAAVALIDPERLPGRGASTSGVAEEVAEDAPLDGATETAPELPATPPAATAAPPAEQGWHPDPTGRHQLRWHDGRAWTTNVSDDGATRTDEGI